MPYFGLGVYLSKQPYNSVIHALKCGYRLIDTAEFYGNEKECGRAIRDSGIDREEIFVTSKLWHNHRGYDEARKAFFDSFHKLGLEYIDLYLIHSPLNGGKIIETYDALVDLQKEGYVRSVGVSNFGVHHLESIAAAKRPIPSVNQIELHCFFRQDEIVKYCHKEGIIVNGYSPVARCSENHNSLLQELATKYRKTICQIMIRWSLQKGYITIPKSEQPAHIEENCNVYDFNIAEEDMEKMEHLPHHQVAWNPYNTPWRG